MTMAAIMVQSHTSAFFRVSIDVEPNRVLQTSAEMFEDEGKRFMSI